MKGKFIVIEGIDGSGKTTIIKRLSKKLSSQNFKVRVTKEPSEGPIGQFIRKYINETNRRDPILETLLFAADRRWHIENIIKPSLEIYDYVISDRYVYSSVAYQTVSSLINEEYIYIVNRHILKPDYSFFIDIEPELTLKRINRKKNIFEELSYLRKVYKIYRNMVKKGYLIRIEGRARVDDIVEVILKYII